MWLGNGSCSSPQSRPAYRSETSAISTYKSGEENDLRQRREAAGLNQGELAEALDVTRQTIDAIERDRYVPPLELAFRLAAHFERHTGDIVQPEENDDST